MSPTPASPLRTWLQLLRAPNLFTVPGDPLAGFLLASAGQVDGRLAGAALASLCFYGHGLLLNDLADLAEDRRDRPERPLPSGAAQPPTVWIAAAALAVGALLLCLGISPATALVGLVLLAVVVLYNLRLKRVAHFGPFNMGLCRGLSLLLGATAALPAQPISTSLPTLVWLAAGGLTIYIAAITHLARIETLADPPLLPRKWPFIALLLVIVGFFVAAIDRAHPLTTSNLCLYLVFACTLYAGYQIHAKLMRQPAPPIPPMIGQLIRLLLPIQAGFCLASRSIAGGIAAVLLLLLWPVSRSVSRRFYAS